MLVLVALQQHTARHLPRVGVGASHARRLSSLVRAVFLSVSLSLCTGFRYFLYVKELRRYSERMEDHKFYERMPIYPQIMIMAGLHVVIGEHCEALSVHY